MTALRLGSELIKISEVKKKEEYYESAPTFKDQVVEISD